MPHLVAFSSEPVLFEPRVHNLRHRRDRIRIRGGLHESTAHALAAPQLIRVHFNVDGATLKEAKSHFEAVYFFYHSSS